MAQLSLAIVTPDREALAIECGEVVAPGVNGEIGLLPGHVPLVTAIRPGVLTVVKGGRRTFYAVNGGFAEIEGSTVTILTNSCEVGSEIDLERAKRALAESERKLEQMSAEEGGYVALRERALAARARIDAATRR